MPLPNHRRFVGWDRDSVAAEAAKPAVVLKYVAQCFHVGSGITQSDEVLPIASVYKKVIERSSVRNFMNIWKVLDGLFSIQNFPNNIAHYLHSYSCDRGIYAQKRNPYT